ncbi:hypothetical protein I552_3211 [Mycobacterium xenopi 3993]|nr:hypothetical protein I552_3211 [Mycobacterium xenopi 3993]
MAIPRRLNRAALVDFGRRAKREVLCTNQAHELAAGLGVHLSGHGGSCDGVIGALAAVGLHLSGNDGLFITLPGWSDCLPKPPWPSCARWHPSTRSATARVADRAPASLSSSATGCIRYSWTAGQCCCSSRPRASRRSSAVADRAALCRQTTLTPGQPTAVASWQL